MADVRFYSYFAGGEWREAGGRRTFEVSNPYDRSVYARVAAGGRAEAKIAIKAAAEAFPAWAETTPAQRARCSLRLRRLSSVVGQRSPTS